jgi:hypothetical protein
VDSEAQLWLRPDDEVLRKLTRLSELDQLLYLGQWVAIKDGRVITSGRSSPEVVFQLILHDWESDVMFCVGDAENTALVKIR